MRLESRASLLFVGVLLISAVACHDASTGPRLQSPLVGTWELTTHFTLFSFETGAPSPPDCMYPDMYCTHFRTTTDGAYLGGTVEVRDSSSSTDTVSKSVVASGTVETRFCDQIDSSYITAAGCLHMGDFAAKSYSGYITGKPDSTTPGSLDVAIGEPNDSYVGISISMRSYDATYAGDSIYGTVYWGESGGRSPPTYRGTFVMRRAK
jgi:hypothetical protein